MGIQPAIKAKAWTGMLLQPLLSINT